MAVYKPTNCTPFLSVFDVADVSVGKPHFFECRVDTSNTKITAYSILIYNEENTQVFPVDENGNPTDARMSPVSELKKYFKLRGLSEEGYTYLNTGINGTYLRIPVFMSAEEKKYGDPGWDYISLNSLYVTVENGETSVVDCNNIPISIENDFSYKWLITLYQGVDFSTSEQTGELITTPPIEYKDYDMVITAGQVIGSTYERIQSYLSDEIYMDYYVQLCKIPGLKITDEDKGIWTKSENQNIEESSAPRVRIKSYDYSYGYINLQTGDSGFSVDAVSPEYANGFRIYTMSNDPDVISSSRIANLMSSRAIPWVWEFVTGAPSRSYGVQTYYIHRNNTMAVADARGGKYYPFNIVYSSDIYNNAIDTNRANCYLARTGAGSYSVSNGDVVLLNNQAPNNETYLNGLDDGESPGSYTEASAFNGVYSPSCSLVDPESDEDEYYKVIITWNRTTGTNTWGALATAVMYVSQDAGTESGRNYSGSNMQIGSGADEELDITTGTINVTPIKWIPERPVEIYTHDSNIQANNKDINTTGIIFYNQALDPDDPDSKGRIYIRPFVGIEKGMWWQEMGSLASQNLVHFIIKDLNTTTWCITYDKLYTGKNTLDENIYEDIKYFKEDKTRYQIRSYFKQSDENTFYLEANPEINIILSTSEENVEEYLASGEKDLIYGDTANSETQTSITVGSRRCYCYGQYDQDNNVSWRSYEWMLYNGRGEIVQQSETGYEGKINFTLTGLVSGEVYTLALTVENNMGCIVSTSVGMVVEYKETPLSFPFEASLNCEAQVVEINSLVTGYVLPNEPTAEEPLAEVRVMKDNDTNPSIEGVSYDPNEEIMKIQAIDSGDPLSGNASASPVSPNGVYYGRVSSALDNTMSLTDFTVGGNAFCVQSAHKITDKEFCGSIWSVTYDVPSNTSARTATFSVNIPPMLDEEGNINLRRNVFEWTLTILNVGSSSQDTVYSGTAYVYWQGNTALGEDPWIETGQWKVNEPLFPYWQGDSFTPSGNGAYVPTRQYMISNVSVGNNTADMNEDLVPANHSLAIAGQWNCYDLTNGNNVYEFKSPLVSWANFSDVQSGAYNNGGAEFKVLGNAGEMEVVFYVQPEDENETFIVPGSAPLLWQDYDVEVVHDVVNAASTGNVRVAGEENPYNPLSRWATNVELMGSPWIWEDDPLKQGSGTEIVGNNAHQMRWLDGDEISNGNDAAQRFVLPVNHQKAITGNLANAYTVPYGSYPYAVRPKSNNEKLLDTWLVFNVAFNGIDSTEISPIVQVFLTGNSYPVDEESRIETLALLAEMEEENKK